MKRTYLVLVGDLSHTARNPVEREDGSLEWTDTAGVRHVAPPGTWEETTGRKPSPRFDN